MFVRATQSSALFRPTHAVGKPPPPTPGNYACKECRRGGAGPNHRRLQTNEHIEVPTRTTRATGSQAFGHFQGTSRIHWSNENGIMIAWPRASLEVIPHAARHQFDTLETRLTCGRCGTSQGNDFLVKVYYDLHFLLYILACQRRHGQTKHCNTGELMTGFNIRKRSKKRTQSGGRVNLMSKQFSVQVVELSIGPLF